jgi:hypothetical protein
MSNNKITDATYDLGASVTAWHSAMTATTPDPPSRPAIKDAFRRRLQANGLGIGKYDKALYMDVPTERIIEALGTYNPTYRGNLKKQVEPLVKMVAGDCASRYGYYAKCVGLAYAIPYVRHKQRRRWRATSQALALMAHWNEKFPSFRRFHDCYVTPAGVKLINTECDLLRRNVVPDRLQKNIDDHNVELVKQKLLKKEVTGQLWVNSGNNLIFTDASGVDHSLTNNPATTGVEVYNTYGGKK